MIQTNIFDERIIIKKIIIHIIHHIIYWIIDINKPVCTLIINLLFSNVVSTPWYSMFLSTVYVL